MRTLRTFNWFTLIELLVTITIIIILASVLLPALKRSRDSAKAILCKNNQKQISQGLMFYINDYNGRALPPVPSPYYWTTVIAREYRIGNGTAGNPNYLKMNVWNCPMYRNYNGSAEISPDSSAYGMNYYSFSDLSSSYGEHSAYVPMTAVRKPGEHLWITETFAANQTITGIYRANPNIDVSGNGRVSNVHGNNANVLFCDGHIETRKTLDLNSGSWSIFSSQEPWNYYLR